MGQKVRFDGIDMEIIRALQKDARTNFADIAQKSGVSIDTISKRFKRMNRIGIVKGTTVLLNPKSFGYDCVACFGLRADIPHVEEVVDFMGKVPEVVFCVPSMGRYNIFAIGILENVGKLGRVKEHLKGHPRVKEVDASIWIDEILLCPENFDLENLMKE